MRFLIVLSIILSLTVVAQTNVFTIPQIHKSIHQEESEKYAAYKLTSDKEWDSVRFYQTGKIQTKNSYSPRACNLTKKVYGWHPYWQNGLQSNYDWTKLSTLCYFSYEVNPADGNAITTNGWATAQVVTAAQTNGIDVTLCATLFSGHTTFFSNATAQQTLITNLIVAVQSRNAKGINIDFEGMSSSDKAPFTAFMINLCNQMHTAIPASEVSLALYAVDWNNVFDIAALNNAVDLFIIMGYDYYWSGSASTGPNDPLFNFESSYNRCLSEAITYYLNKGASNSKLLLGLPYYGREWSTTALTIPANTTGSSNTVTYRNMRINSNGYYSNPQWDANSFSTWFASTRSGTPWHTFIDDENAMDKRFNIVNQRSLAGIGIWALGYDDGFSNFWNLIEKKFTTCSVNPCVDTIYDMGGPNKNYYNNEDYTYTISPTNAYAVTLNFLTFSIQSADSLWIYDGATTANSSLIGVYTGTNNPGTITSTENSITIRFKSNGSGISSGWKAIWQCLTDAIVPSTQINLPNGWITQNFTATYTDSDNTGGAGVKKAFYQVSSFNGNEWRSNPQNGFFNDNFDSAVHPDWTKLTGTWSISVGKLNQTNETNANTNIYSSLAQNAANAYLYHWQGKITGTGSNRRAGFHFFCDNGSATNRGNSYLVWFRVDDAKLQIYKVINDVLGTPVVDIPFTTIAGQWYDYKISYDKITGKISIFRDNVFVTNWIDLNPFLTGNSISFRTGNSTFSIDELKVYKSRNASTPITAGFAQTNDILHQNANLVSPSGIIRSLVMDAANNLSTIAAQNLNVDWTSPFFNDTIINDGLGNDIAFTNSLTTLSANWNMAIDTNSAVTNFWYSIGTSAGATDVVNWTNNGVNTTVTRSGLTLIVGQTYYFNIKSENGAGLQSAIYKSNGQKVNISINTEEFDNTANIVVFPNPFTNYTTLTYTLQEKANVEISLIDVLGKRITLFEDSQENGSYKLKLQQSDYNLSSGIYFIMFKINDQIKVVKISSE